MATKSETISLLKDEINEIRQSHPKLKDDSAFVFWFLRAYIADSEVDALNALTGGSGDKGIDAIFIDTRAKQVHLVQGKFHYSLGEQAEKRNDILNFSELSSLPWESKEVSKAFYSKLEPSIRPRLDDAIHSILDNKYELRLYYVTTGRCSKAISDEAHKRVRQAEGPTSIAILDADKVKTIFHDYLNGVAPAVQELELRIAEEDNASHGGGVIHKFDPIQMIESWVFSMSADSVGEMFTKAGIRLFARNIRGYFGENNEINEAMADTVENYPENFWYYNNGVTIVCDDAKEEIQAGGHILRVERPQVINGQQTTRTLNKTSSPKARVLIKVIRIPRTENDEQKYDDFVSAIVRATNWQNPILPSDLISNDHVQVFLERELRKRGYQYLRKRQKKSEARSYAEKGLFQIKKEEIAQAVAACELDPAIVRRGKEGLFNERYYGGIFNSRSVAYYLSRYWLMRSIAFSASGYPERAYAKWVVLHFTWSKLSDHIGSGSGERKFRYISERKKYGVLRKLDSFVDNIFKAAMIFYKSQRGRGSKAKDISSFFQQTHLHHDFETFWHSNRNPHGAKAEKRLKEFLKAFDEFELPA